MKLWTKIGIIFLSGFFYWVLTGDISIAIFGISLICYLELRHTN